MTTSFFLDGIDSNDWVWGAGPHADPGIEAWKCALVAGQQDGLVELALALPETDQAKCGATRLLLEYFTDAAAEALSQADRLDERMAFEQALNHYPVALGWLCRTPEGVQRAEGMVDDLTQRVDPKSGNETRMPHLGERLSQLATTAPNQTMACLLAMDLPTAFGRHAVKTPWEPWSHWGMRVLAKVLVSPKDVDEEQFIAVAQRMMSKPVLVAALGRKYAQDSSVVLAQINPLVRAVVGTEYESENLRGLSRLGRMGQQSPWLGKLLEGYFALDSLPEKSSHNHLATQSVCPDRNRLAGVLNATSDKDIIKAAGLIDCLVMGGRQIVKQAIFEGTPNAEVFWRAMTRGANLHGFLNTCSSSEIVALLPELVQRMGQWRDSAGNNLAHLVALVTKVPEKQALMTLSRLPGGCELLTTPNHRGFTPQDEVNNHPKWRDEAAKFRARLAEQISRVRKGELTNLAKEMAPGRRTMGASRRCM